MSYELERRLSWTLPMEEPGQGWSIVLTRATRVGFTDRLIIAMHYNDKEISTHEKDMTIEDAREMFAELLHDDENSPVDDTTPVRQHAPE